MNHTQQEIQTLLNYISQREDIPKKWLLFNIGTNKHVGTRIPAKIVTGEERGDYINPTAFEITDKIYYYAGYDMIHRESKLKNFYYDTKENIISYLKSQCEFQEGTTQEEVDEHIEHITRHRPIN